MPEEEIEIGDTVHIKTTISAEDIPLFRVAWQLSLDHVDNEFGVDMIIRELNKHRVGMNTLPAMAYIVRMLELDIIEVREVGTLYRCTDACSSSTSIELTIVPYNEELQDMVLQAVRTAVEPFKELVDIED